MEKSKAGHLTFESENLAFPEVHTHEAEANEVIEDEEEDSIEYDTLAIPEIHVKRGAEKLDESNHRSSEYVGKMMDRMKSGKLYKCVDWDPKGIHKKAMDVFNNSSRTETKDRTEKYLKPVFGSMGKNCYIEPPIYYDYGCNIHVGDNFYANTGLIVLDQCDVRIGNNVFFAPRVNIYCACHPIDALVRNTNLELGKPITIGDDVWVGGNVVINPGVTIGSNVVIGSGSVVTKDIPDNCVAAGNPCRVIRPITSEDHDYWMSQLREYESDMGEKI